MKITIRKPDDFHLHLRDKAMLQNVAHYTQDYGRVLVMPNVSPFPILTGADADAYRDRIRAAFFQCQSGCEPLMTIQITEQTTPQMIFDAKEHRVIAGKVYPQGETTNSGNGVRDYDKLLPVFRAMSRCGMILCLHGEVPHIDKSKPKVSVLKREGKFLKILVDIAMRFKQLKIVLEHITTEEAVDTVLRLPENVAATITAHHLVLNLDDIIGGDKLLPHNFCKPVAKEEPHRLALVQAATSGNPKFFFGSDSAPHLRKDKECAEGCAGIFSAPVALPVLAEVFAKNNALEKLEDFTSVFGAQFYNYPLRTETITLLKMDWAVPETLYRVVPFMAGKKLAWQVE
ncbi:MAG TPA: dihydroorotase [Patescibacteria group bacterium]|jgi:dihydroorotase|nr:dihydroorotase [Patescibacteria group bacterium]